MERTYDAGSQDSSAVRIADAPAEPGNGTAASVAASAESGETGVGVDLTALLLKSWVRSPDTAVAGSVDDDPTTRWYTFSDETGFSQIDSLPAEPEIALLVRTPPARQPAWHALLRDYLHVDGFNAAVGESAGAVLFVRADAEGRTNYVAWCFGSGSAWITRKAASPRFGLLAALNAAARSALASSDGVGVVGATVAARGGNLKRASLIASVPAPSGAMPRIDTLADVLTAARVRAGHEILGKVSAGRSLQFPDVVGSVARFRELSALAAGLAAGLDYRAMEGWIDDTIPEEDEDVINKVLGHVWERDRRPGQCHRRGHRVVGRRPRGPVRQPGLLLAASGRAQGKKPVQAHRPRSGPFSNRGWSRSGTAMRCSRPISGSSPPTTSRSGAARQLTC